MLQVNADDLLLNVVDQGQGLPILFVHGFPLDHTMWQAQIDELSKTCRVIAPDLRGFGNSGVTEGTVSMDMFADDIALLLDALQVRNPVCFCGLSMGGYIAWAFVRRHAARLNSLILCDTRASADTADAVEGRLKMAAEVLEHGPEVVVTAMRPKLFAPSTADTRTDLVDRVCDMIRTSNPQGVAAALRGMAGRPDSNSLLSRIPVPTLLVVGEHDQISTVDEMRGIAQRIQGAQLAVVPNAGHMAPMENPQTVNEVINRFLAEIHRQV